MKFLIWFPITLASAMILAHFAFMYYPMFATGFTIALIPIAVGIVIRDFIKGKWSW